MKPPRGRDRPSGQGSREARGPQDTHQSCPEAEAICVDTDSP